jgi:hypothetical protein
MDSDCDLKFLNPAQVVLVCKFESKTVTKTEPANMRSMRSVRGGFISRSRGPF